ncbi:WD40 repeat domain-containing serine/threonine-protein kinase [Aureliella helgolandensis]|uniref:Serine/threonine-protein kinase PrkC n=1 Tax=Aureliella helgolandensis TaxID=2527968 RepID=A0A518GF60_9BACT|nr:WD40 repeat domain-containing serine/threonine-protein kinase [Aureliella helgolandensis]QDV27235.1 Serine/threonine-protein kinase PrkC [Aureliella helgolandensis]
MTPNPDSSKSKRLETPTAFDGEVATDLSPEYQDPESHAPPESHVGSVVGDYRVLSEIGRGGIGVVYRAVHTQTGKTVALKLLQRSYGAQRRHLRRFRREAQAVQSLKHNHIVPLHESGEHQGVHFLAMELIAGQTLADLITDQARCRQATESATLANDDEPTQCEHKKILPSIAFEDLAHSIANIADAVHAAHLAGVIHRDIKPSNILRDDSGKLWLTDFGLATLGNEHTALTLTGDVLGTPAYMSPEQASGSTEGVSPLTDVYSLGASLFELTTLQKPYLGSRDQILLGVVQGDLTPPRRVRSGIPPALEAITLKAMAFSPTGRYVSAAELASDLRRFAGGESTLARLPSWRERLYRWSERNPLVALVTLVGVSATIAGVLIVQSLNSKTLRNVNLQLQHSNQRLRITNEQLATRESQLKQQLYVSDMAVAFKAYESGKFLTARKLLEPYAAEDAEPDLRGFGWRLLNKLTAPPESILLAYHSGMATESALFDGGRQALSVGHDGEVHQLDLEAGTELRRHTMGGKLDAVAVAPDGSWMLVGIHAPTGVHRVAYRDLDNQKSPTQLATINEISNWKWHWTTVESLAVSPNGEFFASADRYQELQLHSADGASIRNLTNDSRNESLAFLDQGEWLACIYRHTRGAAKLRVLSTSSERNLDFECGFSPNVLAYSGHRPGSETSWIAVAGVDDIAIFEWPSGEKISRLNNVSARIRCVDISHDGRVVAAGCDEGLMLVWHAREAEHAGEFRPPQVIQASDQRITSIKLRPDSNALQPATFQMVTTSEDGDVRLWKVPRPIPPAPGIAGLPPAALQVSDVWAVNRYADQMYLRLQGGEIVEFNGEDSPSRVLAKHPCDEFGRICSVGSENLIVAAGQAELLFLDAQTGSVRNRLPASDAEQDCQDLLHLGETIYALYQNHLLLIDTHSHQVKSTLWLPTKDAKQLLQVPQTEDVLVVAEGAIYQIRDPQLAPLAEASSAASLFRLATFSPAGDHLAIVQSNRTLRVLSTDGLQPPILLRGHQEAITDCIFIDDGATLVSSSVDRTLRFWDIATGRELGVLNQPEMQTQFLHYFEATQTLFCSDQGSGFQFLPAR